jgi:hypothetical protein
MRRTIGPECPTPIISALGRSVNVSAVGIRNGNPDCDVDGVGEARRQIVIKLYKKNGGIIEYWEIWQNGRDLIIHRGGIGDRGTAHSWHVTSDIDLAREMRRLAGVRLDEGFAEVPSARMAEVMLRRSVDGFSTESERDGRHALEDALDDVLGWTGNGHVDGGDAGDSELSVYCFVIDPQAAVRTIREEILSRLEFRAYTAEVTRPSSFPDDAK